MTSHRCVRLAIEVTIVRDDRQSAPLLIEFAQRFSQVDDRDAMVASNGLDPLGNFVAHVLASQRVPSRNDRKDELILMLLSQRCELVQITVEPLM